MGDTKEYAVVDGKLEVTKTIEEVKVASYDYNFLVSQRASIQAQKDRDNAQRDLELAEVDALILKAKEYSLDVVAEVGVIAVP